MGEALPTVVSLLRQTQQPDGSWGSSLDTALALVALMDARYRGDALGKGIAALLARQGADGSWPAGVYYTGLPLSYFYGSQEVTTAFAAEALAKYTQRRDGGQW